MSISPEQLDRVISAIHATPPMVVIEIAGAGAQAVTWLHGVGGSSRTILEATDRYAAASLTGAIGFAPDRFTSPQVARAMASHAFRRAAHLAGVEVPVAGIGCTATIATDRLKRGEHRCSVAVCDAHGVMSYSLTLTKGHRTRRQEEELVSLLILRAVANVCGVTGLPEPELIEPETLTEQYEPADLLHRLVDGEFDWIIVEPDGRMVTGQTRPNLALLSGAFNPLHQGHRQLAELAAQKLQQEVYFELPVVNADKGKIGQAETRRRAAQFAGWGTVVLTRAPLFSQKAKSFPGSVFVLGVDTVQRLTEPRFYNDDPAEMWASFAAVQAAGCHFLVAGRLVDNRFFTLGDVDLPEPYRPLFEEIPPEKFRVDMSSTAIRNEQSR